MIDLQRSNSPSQSACTMPEVAESLLQNWFTISTLLGRDVLALRNYLVSSAEEADRRHRRAELLAAYHRRHSWKMSDIPRLKTLGVNKAALRRMQRLAGRGRPVVRPHEPLALAVARKVHGLEPLFNPLSSPDKLRRAFKLWPWWQHYVEAVYRGEHDLAKKRRIAGPSDHAERVVGRALGISAATVHRICGEIRRMRKEWDGSADFPSMTLIEYENRMKTGIIDGRKPNDV